MNTFFHSHGEDLTLTKYSHILRYLWGLLVQDSFAEILKDVIENEITNPDFGVDEFCEVAAMSRSQLYRKLKATVDMSVSEFIRVHRVKLASELFKNKNLNVTDVCYSSGFTDTSYFSKSFKEVFKVPPTEYRKKLHAENDSEIE